MSDREIEENPKAVDLAAEKSFRSIQNHLSSRSWALIWYLQSSNQFTRQTHTAFYTSIGSKLLYSTAIVIFYDIINSTQGANILMVESYWHAGFIQNAQELILEF